MAFTLSDNQVWHESKSGDQNMVGEVTDGNDLIHFVNPNLWMTPDMLYEIVELIDPRPVEEEKPAAKAPAKTAKTSESDS